MSFRFLHLADLHLETCFGGKPETRERLREATLQSFDRAVDYALEHGLHAVLAAGDLFDDPILSLGVQLRVVKRVRELAEAGCWFLYCCGNHDPGRTNYKAAHLGLSGDGDPEPWQERVQVFRTSEPQEVTVTDRDGNPVGLVIGAGHVTSTESQNLCTRFPTMEQLGRKATELPVVGLLHTQVESARSADQHDRYAPSVPADYERRAYSYWALGHVHLRQQAVAGLPVWYPGNLQGRNPRETGDKGGLVVTARAGAAAEPEFQPFAPVRWAWLEIDDLGDIHTVDGLARRLADAVRAESSDADELAVRVILRGPCPLATSLRDGELDDIAAEIAERTGALEVQLRTGGLHVPVPIEELRRSTTVMAKALEIISAARSDPDTLRALAPARLANDVADGPQRDAYLGSLLDGLEGELLARLADPEHDA